MRTMPNVVGRGIVLALSLLLARGAGAVEGHPYRVIAAERKGRGGANAAALSQGAVVDGHFPRDGLLWPPALPFERRAFLQGPLSQMNCAGVVSLSGLLSISR